MKALSRKYSSDRKVVFLVGLGPTGSSRYTRRVQSLLWPSSSSCLVLHKIEEDMCDTVQAVAEGAELILGLCQGVYKLVKSANKSTKARCRPVYERVQDLERMVLNIKQRPENASPQVRDALVKLSKSLSDATDLIGKVYKANAMATFFKAGSTDSKFQEVSQKLNADMQTLTVALQISHGDTLRDGLRAIMAEHRAAGGAAAAPAREPVDEGLPANVENLLATVFANTPANMAANQPPAASQQVPVVLPAARPAPAPALVSPAPVSPVLVSPTLMSPAPMSPAPMSPALMSPAPATSTPMWNYSAPVTSSPMWNYPLVPAAPQMPSALFYQQLATSMMSPSSLEEELGLLYYENMAQILNFWSQRRF
ncbi:uncharacterized protein LOC144016561 [Festucalex cinctus]